MRKTFPGHYRPSDAEFKKLWNKCLFVLDANVLLNLYRYSATTTKELVDMLKQVGDRLWVPHQAAYEYQKNRLSVISKQRRAYDEIEKLLAEVLRKIEAELRGYKRHPVIEADQIMEPIAKVFEQQISELEKVRKQHPELLEKDDIREELTTLLEGKIGDPYSEEKLKELYRDGEVRYSKSVPPGYEDAKTKPGDDKYGDLVLWRQIVDKAAKDQVPVIVVTDDVKEDWWWRHEGRIVGPRPELVTEMAVIAKVPFYMYQTDQFMDSARRYLRQMVAQGAIDEVREVRHRDEEFRSQLYDIVTRQEAVLKETFLQLQETEAALAHVEASLRSLVHDQPDPYSDDKDNPKKAFARVAHLEELRARRRVLRERLQMLHERKGYAEAVLGNTAITGELTPDERKLMSGRCQWLRQRMEERVTQKHPTHKGQQTEH